MSKEYGRNKYDKKKGKGKGRKGGRDGRDEKGGKDYKRTWKKDLNTMSRGLTKVLRHDAVQLGLNITGGGYVKVSDLAKLNRFHGLTEEDVKTIAANDNKNRFKWVMSEDGMVVRANQGHTFKLQEEEIFTRIQRPEELDACIHGTYSKFLSSILESGLSKMNRTHVHFTPSPVVTAEARSGFRGTCDVLIHLDVRRALQDGLKLFRSDNNVILCPGDTKGLISSNYFAKVESRWTGEVLFTNRTSAKSVAQPEPMEIEPKRQLPPGAMNVTNHQSHSGCRGPSPVPARNRGAWGTPRQHRVPNQGQQQQQQHRTPQPKSFQEIQQAGKKRQQQQRAPRSPVGNQRQQQQHRPQPKSFQEIQQAEKQQQQRAPRSPVGNQRQQQQQQHRPQPQSFEAIQQAEMQQQQRAQSQRIQSRPPGINQRQQHRGPPGINQRQQHRAQSLQAIQQAERRQQQRTQSGQATQKTGQQNKPMSYADRLKKN